MDLWVHAPLDNTSSDNAGPMDTWIHAPLDNTSSENDRGRDVAQGNLKIFSRLAEMCNVMISSCHARTSRTEGSLNRLTDVQSRDAARAHAARRTTPSAPRHVRLRDLHSRDAAHAAQNAEQARSTLSAATERYILSLEHHNAAIKEIRVNLEMIRDLATDESLEVHGIGASPAEAHQHDPETLRLPELAQSHIQQEGHPSSYAHNGHKRRRRHARRSVSSSIV